MQDAATSNWRFEAAVEPAVTVESAATVKPAATVELAARAERGKFAEEITVSGPRKQGKLKNVMPAVDILESLRDNRLLRAVMAEAKLLWG